MSQKELYSARLERVGLDLYGKQYKGKLAKALQMDRTQLWRHLNKEFDGTETAKAYNLLLDKLEDTVNVQQGSTKDTDKIKLHLQILQEQVKKIFIHLDMEKDYEQLKW